MLHQMSPAMAPLLRLSRFIDRLNEGVGRLVYWLVLAMVLIGAYNALARYLGRYIGVDLSSNIYIELQWYLFSLVFLLGAGYALRHNAHVRVDVFYGRLSERGQAWLNFLGSVLFLLPFCGLMWWVSWPAIESSWAVWERSPDPGGLPRNPIKTVILVCFALLGLQGISQAIKHANVLWGTPEPKPMEDV